MKYLRLQKTVVNNLADLNLQHPDLEVIYCELSDQQICQQVWQKSALAKNEFNRRVNNAEIEGDYVMAIYLYKLLLTTQLTL